MEMKILIEEVTKKAATPEVSVSGSAASIEDMIRMYMKNKPQQEQAADVVVFMEK